MNINLRKIEKLKYKNDKNFLIFAIALAASMVYVAIMLFDKSFLSKENQWLNLLDNLMISHVIIYPLFIASLVSKSVEIENSHNMWKIIYTCGIDHRKILIYKILNIFKKISYYQIFEWIVFICFSRLKGVKEEIDLERFIIYFLSQIAITSLLMAIHYIISLKNSNQLVSISIAILGTLTGLMGLFFEKISLINPYSWYGKLSSIEYTIIDKNTFTSSIRPINYETLILSSILACILLIYALKIKEKE